MSALMSDAVLRSILVRILQLEVSLHEAEKRLSEVERIAKNTESSNASLGYGRLAYGYEDK